ncbi:cytochrome c3 family protein [Planctomycetota bacterium]
MSDTQTKAPGRRLRGGAGGPLLVLVLLSIGVGFIYPYYISPHTTRAYGYDLRFDHAMFGPTIEQPIPFSHRLHATDKRIDCQYCHPYVERSMNAGLPSVAKCLGCHDYIIPHHEEIERLRGFQERKEPVPWVRVYYNPDHVFFPHYRHLRAGVECRECHGEVETVDRLRKVTFYMGLCIGCHRERNAPLECVGCHQ